MMMFAKCFYTNRLALQSLTNHKTRVYIETTAIQRDSAHREKLLEASENCVD